jgi:flagellin-specific chaperone FliS
MLIAKEKRKQNIIEYLLYLFQVEDTIRACQFNITCIEQRVINQFKVGEETKKEIRNWYTDLIVMMHQEGIKKSGHLRLVATLINDLHRLHKRILEIEKNKQYIELFFQALPNIQAFSKKMNKNSGNEVEICLIALYGLLLLRLQKKEISDETLEAMQTFSNMLAMLSDFYKRSKQANS